MFVLLPFDPSKSTLIPVFFVRIPGTSFVGSIAFQSWTHKRTLFGGSRTSNDVSYKTERMPTTFTSLPWSIKDLEMLEELEARFPLRKLAARIFLNSRDNLTFLPPPSTAQAVRAPGSRGQNYGSHRNLIFVSSVMERGGSRPSFTVAIWVNYSIGCSLGLFSPEHADRRHYFLPGAWATLDGVRESDFSAEFW